MNNQSYNHSRRARAAIYIQALIACIAVTGAVGAWYVYTLWRAPRIQVEIIPYDHARDSADVIRMFDENWFWMIPVPKEEYDLVYRLEHAVSDTNTERARPMTMLVARTHGKAVGLLTYYPKSSKRASILYLITDTSVRRTGVARALLARAFANMKAEGYTSVELFTLHENVRSQALYRSEGFQVFSDTGAGVLLERAL